MPGADRVRAGGGPRLSRRVLLLGAATALVASGAAASDARAVPTPGAPEAWRTWLLNSADELRPAAPPPPSAAEFDELRRLQAGRTAATPVP